MASIVGNIGEGSGQHFLDEIYIGYEQLIRRYPKASNYVDNVKQIFGKEGSIQRADSKASQLYLLAEFFPHIEGAAGIIQDYIEK
jgi:hypothetical protein